MESEKATDFKKFEPKSSSVRDLPKSVKDAFSTDEILKSILMKKIRDKWIDLVGPVLGDHSYPKDYNFDTLQVLTNHSAYSQEIMFQNHKILVYLQKELKLESIKNIRCVIGNFPKSKKKKFEKKVGTLEGKDHLVHSLDKIEDEKLRQNLLELVKLMD
ncbi:MAG: DUF721 domain-containing protein [Leptospira sp.]|nr:DUF721 domain-containing protein [Leptospira sp.]